MLDAAGKPEEAAAALNKALVAAPKRADLYWRTAAFLIANGKTDEALKMLDRAAGNMPEDREILLAKAVVLELAKQTGDCYNLLADIQGRWPEWQAGWVAHGIVLEKHGRSEEARQAMETAISLGARSPEAFYYLAASSLGSAPKRLDAAEAAIGRALQLAPDDPWIQALAGRIAEERGDHAGAVDRLREAIRLDAGPAQAHSDLARAYTALGRKQEAQTELDLAKKRVAGDPQYLIELLQSRPPSDW
jgi:Flp pilus assembly protein TadD